MLSALERSLSIKATSWYMPIDLVIHIDGGMQEMSIQNKLPAGEYTVGERFLTISLGKHTLPQGGERWLVVAKSGQLKGVGSIVVLNGWRRAER